MRGTGGHRGFWDLLWKVRSKTLNTVSVRVQVRLFSFRCQVFRTVCVPSGLYYLKNQQAHGHQKHAGDKTQDCMMVLPVFLG